jgi:hypothetical protein
MRGQVSKHRQWKQNTVGSTLDEYYDYDDLNRLVTMQRGTLTGGPPFTGISGTPAREQDWTLDKTGNWTGFIDKTSGMTDLNQSRTANKVNEITNITASGGTPVWATPAYDAAGNTTTFPQLDNPVDTYTATYDAWNRMTSVSGFSGLIADYAYDGLGRRIYSLLEVAEPASSSSSGETTESRHFFYSSQWQDIEEWVVGAANPQDQYVWGLRYIDELVTRDDASSTRLYAMQDANFVTLHPLAVIERANPASPERDIGGSKPVLTRSVTKPSRIGGLGSPPSASTRPKTLRKNGIFSFCDWVDVPSHPVVIVAKY